METILEEGRECFAKKCPKCQEHMPVPSYSSKELTSVMSLWPFAQWGLNIVGLFPMAKGVVKFMDVAVDYFKKWVKAKALATIATNVITRFLYKSMVCMFDIPPKASYLTMTDKSIAHIIGNGAQN